MWRLLIFWSAATLCAQQHSLDVVIVLDGSPGVQRDISAAALTKNPSDRFAVVRYTKESRVVQPFTNDPRKVADAIRRVGGQGSVYNTWGHPSTTLETRLLRAVLVATHLFDSLPVDAGRLRVIIAVFATDDTFTTPTEAEVKSALLRQQIKFFGIAIRRYDSRYSAIRVQTPPTLPGTTNTGNLAAYPERTVALVEDLASETGGQFLSKSADISAILAQLRSGN